MIVSKFLDWLPCLISLEPPSLSTEKMVKIDPLQKQGYDLQFKNKNTPFVSYIIHFLCLKKEIEIPKLQQAIKDTLNNHFLLNSKIVTEDDEFFFKEAAPQRNFIFKGSYFFPKKNISKLIITVYSKRLVNIFLYKKKGNYYLIISFHHIAVDGWSHKIIQEEIFRRYADLHPFPNKNLLEEITALNHIHAISVDQKSNTNELKGIYKDIVPEEYSRINHLFNKKNEAHSYCFLLKRADVDQYARAHHIDDLPYSVILLFMFYHMARRGSQKIN